MLKDGCTAWTSAVWISLYLSSTFGFLTKSLPPASVSFLRAEPKTQASVLGVHLRSHLGGIAVRKWNREGREDNVRMILGWTDCCHGWQDILQNLTLAESQGRHFKTAHPKTNIYPVFPLSLGQLAPKDLTHLHSRMWSRYLATFPNSWSQSGSYILWV